MKKYIGAVILVAALIGVGLTTHVFKGGLTAMVSPISGTSTGASGISSPVTNPTTTPGLAAPVSHLPAGCISTTGYSSTTGQPCSGVPSTPGTSLTINSVTPISGHLSTQVGVGALDEAVGDLRIITGAGGSAKLTGVYVSFYNRGNGSPALINYLSAVSIWLNGVEIGTLPATSLTQSNNQYSALIPVSSAVLNASTTNDLIVAVSALPVVNSANLGATANTWAFEISGVNYSGTSGDTYTMNIPSNSRFDGGNLVSGTLQSSFIVSPASVPATPTLTISRDANDYSDHVVSGQTTTSTQNITLALIDIAAQKSAITMTSLPVHLAVTNPGTGGTNASAVIKTLRLYNSAGTLIDSESVPTGTNPQTVFKQLSTTISAGSTQVFTIKGDLSPVDGTTVAAGSTARISITAADTTAISAYDANNNVVRGSASLLGTVAGSTITFYVNGIQVTSTASSGTATASSVGGSQTHSTLGFTIPFSVTAFGKIAYVPSVAVAATGVSAVHGIQFCVDTPSGSCQAVGKGVITYAGSGSLAVDANGNYTIPAGQTKNFVIQITSTASTTGSYRASLINVNWNNTDSSSAYMTSPTTSNAFKTNYVSANGGTPLL
ncbi:MAG TPA: hypothetical protein VL576_01800 [Candidatus Paceibacterota bacterium]|jgi:hypothetical protein|nr:hypothetical protein [Candidatus Paceibacterota bacterium]